MMILNQKGLSLIEILVTIVLIGIVFTLLSQSIDFLSTATWKHEDRKEATEIVEQELNKTLDLLHRGHEPVDSYIIDQYLVRIDTSKLTESKETSSTLPHKISMTGVFDKESQPNLVTVTVSWGN